MAIRLWKKRTASPAPKRLEAVLGPSSVRVTAFGGWLGRRPLGAREWAVAAPEEGEAVWRGAVAALEAALAERCVRGAALDLTISSQWIRFVLVPRRAELRSAAERQEYARHLFVARFGAAAEAWTLRLAEAAGGAMLACAVEPGLIEALRDACARAGAVLRRVEPLALAVFNRHAKRLNGGRQWFVVPEPAVAFLALLDGGTWQSVAVRRLDEASAETVAALVETAHHLQGIETPATRVVSHAAALAGPLADAYGDYRLEWLGPGLGAAEAMAA